MTKRTFKVPENCTKGKVAYVLIGLLLIPLMTEAYTGIKQTLYINQFQIEGYNIVDLQFGEAHPWIIYQSESNPEIFKAMNIYYDELPFSWTAKCDTDESGTNDKDSWVYQDQKGQNYGLSTSLAAKWMKTTYGNRQWIFISFTMPSGSGSITDIDIKMYCYEADFYYDVLDLVVHEVNDNSWNEGDITWNNMPGVNSPYISLNETSADPCWVTFGIKGTRADNDLNVTWEDSFGVRIIPYQDPDYYATWKFYSKEYTGDTTKRPKLVVTYTPEERSRPFMLKNPAKRATEGGTYSNLQLSFSSRFLLIPDVPSLSTIARVLSSLHVATLPEHFSCI